MITKYENYCVICGKPKEHIHHLIYGTSGRTQSTKFNLLAPLCNECHSFIHGEGKAGAMSKIIGQLQFEKEQVANGRTVDEAREYFRATFGKSYL